MMCKIVNVIKMLNVMTITYALQKLAPVQLLYKPRELLHAHHSCFVS